MFSIQCLLVLAAIKNKINKQLINNRRFQLILAKFDPVEVDLGLLLRLFPLGLATATAAIFSAFTNFMSRLWFSPRLPVWQPQHPFTNRGRDGLRRLVEILTS